MGLAAKATLSMMACSHHSSYRAVISRLRGTLTPRTRSPAYNITRPGSTVLSRPRTETTSPSTSPERQPPARSGSTRAATLWAAMWPRARRLALWRSGRTDRKRPHIGGRCSVVARGARDPVLASHRARAAPRSGHRGPHAVRLPGSHEHRAAVVPAAQLRPPYARGHDLTVLLV